MIEPTPADTAFTNASNHVFGDMELNPYSASRVVAAQALGLKYPNVSELEQFHKTGVYAGALQDTLIVLWLCAVPDKEVMRALREPDESLSKAIEWGAQLKITDTSSEQWWKAYQKFIDIVSEVTDSTGNPKLPDEESDDGPNE